MSDKMPDQLSFEFYNGSELDGKDSVASVNENDSDMELGRHHGATIHLFPARGENRKREELATDISEILNLVIHF